MAFTKKRHESSGSNFSLESMSLSSGGCNDDSFEVVTNTTYLKSKKPKVDNTGGGLSVSPYSPSRFSPISLVSPNTSFSPKTPSYILFTDKSPDGKTHTEGPLYPCTEEAKTMLEALHLFPQSQVVRDPQHLFHRLCPLVEFMIKECPPNRISVLQNRLKRHLRRRRSGGLSVSLVAASYLKIHPDYKEVVVFKNDEDQSKYLPYPIQGQLYMGHFVPMRHLLYGEALMLGFDRHIVNGRAVDPDPYPLNLIKESPPNTFISNIRRPDIFRGLTSHSLILTTRFPRLAARMHNLHRHMWILIYQEKWDVHTAMNLYDAYFKEFEKRLCSLTFMPMDKFPSYLIESVLANRKQ